jgi:hypothetical protein
MQTTEIVTRLLAGRVLSPSQAQLPTSPGFYAWWCRCDRLEDADPRIPLEERPPVQSGWSLLYVGISPSNQNSRRNIAVRLAKDHTGGSIGSSTFRQSVAALLMERLVLQPLKGGDRSRLVSEEALSGWIEASCGVTSAPAERPWESEAGVIKLLNPPLNISKGTHPFRQDVRACRTMLRQACGVAG